MKSFKQFVKEDGEGGVSANVTSNNAMYQSPIGSSQPTAKKKDNDFEADSQSKKIETVTSRGV